MKLGYSAISVAMISAALGCGLAYGQTYPTKPIRIYTVSAGGALDTMIRIIGQGISGPLGQAVVIENRASQTYPEDLIFKGTPDGYTLGYFANAVWLNTFLRVGMPYDPLKDFSPVSLAATGPNVIVITPSLPVRSIAELVAYAKAHPGELNAAVTGVGTSPTNATVLFEAVAGIKMTDVRYKGSAEAFADLAAGRVQVMTPTTLSISSLAKAGKVKILAVTSEQPSALTPDLPTVASLGYKGYESVAIHAFLAPPKTPAAVVNRLNQEVVKLMAQPDIKSKINALGFDAVAGSPAQLTAAMKSEIDKLGPVFKAAGIKPGDAD